MDNSVELITAPDPQQQRIVLPRIGQANYRLAVATPGPVGDTGKVTHSFFYTREAAADAMHVACFSEPLAVSIVLQQGKFAVSFERIEDNPPLDPNDV